MSHPTQSRLDPVAAFDEMTTALFGAMVAKDLDAPDRVAANLDRALKAFEDLHASDALPELADVLAATYGGAS